MPRPLAGDGEGPDAPSHLRQLHQVLHRQGVVGAGQGDSGLRAIEGLHPLLPGGGVGKALPHAAAQLFVQPGLPEGGGAPLQGGQLPTLAAKGQGVHTPQGG